MYNRVNHYWTFVLTIIIINSRKINSTRDSLKMFGMKCSGEREREIKQKEKLHKKANGLKTACIKSVQFSLLHSNPINRMFVHLTRRIRFILQMQNNTIIYG